MTQSTERTSPKMKEVPPWLGVVLFVAGNVCAVISHLSDHDPRLLLGAAVLIPVGALGIANTYTARVRKELLARIEGLERRVGERP